MLQEGIIEESTSPLSSPIIIIPKPNKSLWLCNNFWKLNVVLEFDSYPRVDDLIEHLGRAQFISTLNLTKGYWQVALSRKAYPKMAFTTNSGHWQYWVLPSFQIQQNGNADGLFLMAHVQGTVFPDNQLGAGGW